MKELKSNKSKKEEELLKFNIQLNSLEKNIEQTKEDLKLLENRIDDLQPIEPSTGYYFFVSEKQNETVILEPEIESIIKDKVSKVKGINAEAFMKLFTSGEYHISLSSKDEIGFQIVDDYQKIPNELMIKLSNLGLAIQEDKLVYIGEMIWSDIVNKMIKMGFEQDAEFNKLCGSNSYISNSESKEDIKNNKTTF